MTLLLVAAWFGIVAGLVEGTGLLLFQKINWRDWGAMIHVSPPILWISPLVDLIFFLVLAVALQLASRVWPRLPVFRAAVFAFAALTVYDWLLVPHRLYHVACLLLAAGVGLVFSRGLAKRETAALRFWRRTLPMLAVLLAVLFIGIQGGSWLQEREELAKLPAAAPGSPNVLVIVIDTLRADHVSAYGYSRSTTPNIDRLAQQGVLFENAVSAASWTFPSHVSLLTGKYPFEHGLGKVPPLPLLHSSTTLVRFPMIGEDLERRGYRTGAFSANRVYFDHDLGFGRGFIHFEDYFYSPADMASRTVFGREFEWWALSRGVVQRMLAWLRSGKPLDPDSEQSGSDLGKHPTKANPPRKRGEEINREVLRWIRDGPQRHPFFAFLNYFDVHVPYGGPPHAEPAGKPGLPVDRYDEGVKYVDDCIGQLMAELGRRHLTQDTLVVITSDHGEMLGEHGLSSHGKSLYWDLIHVPLIFWYPGHIPGGVRVPDVVSTSFLPATLSSWLPGGRQFGFPGHSLADLWEGSATSPASYVAFSGLSHKALWENPKLEPVYSVPTDTSGAMKSIVMGHWHLIVHKEFGDQLYDWSKDPQESHNLINTPEGEDVASILTEHLLDLLAGRTGEGDGMEDALGLNPSGAQRMQFIRETSKPSRINDYYHFHANAGSIVKLDVEVLKSEPARELDSILAVENAQGKILATCRNPEDDHLPPPGISDATPDAFDDTCVNDDISPGVESASRLELQVPGNGGVPVNLYIRVSNWNGDLVGPGAGYKLTASETADASVAGQATAPKTVN